MTVRRSFGLDRASVGASRKFVAETLADVPEDIRESAVLMMSELATNAVVHALTGFEVCIERSSTQVRVDDPTGVVDLVGDRGGEQRPDRDRRHKVPVHHIDVEDPRSGLHHLGDLRPQSREVRREDRRCDPRERLFGDG